MAHSLTPSTPLTRPKAAKVSSAAPVRASDDFLGEKNLENLNTFSIPTVFPLER